MFGVGRGPGARRVRGIGSGGPNVLPSSPVGVYGQGGADEAAGVWGAGGTGVVAASNGQPGSIGLFASGNAANELAGEFLGDVFIMRN